ADEQARPPFARSKLGEDVAGRDEVQLRRTFALFELGWRSFDPPVGDGGHENGRIEGPCGEDRLGHLPGGLDIDPLHARRRFKRDRARHQSDPGTPLGCGRGNGETLSSRRAIGDHPDRVDRLVGRARGDQDVLAGEGHLPGRKPFWPSQSSMSCGSGRRPGPYSPHAISPSAGSITLTPSALSWATLRWVAACSHMRTFIAGATTTGLSVASSRVVARSSAMPAAILASKSAVAGQTRMKSAARDSWMWPISTSSLSSHSESWTWLSARVPRLIAVTKCSPPRVSTGVAWCPAFFSSRTSSSDL